MKNKTHMMHDTQMSPLKESAQWADTDAGKRGLASASEETRERVARAGGNALHERRGLQAALPEVRIAIARKGGLARSEQRRRQRQEANETPHETVIIDE